MQLVPGQYQAEAVDEAGVPLAPGASGLLRFRRPGMANEYYRNPQATALAYRDGWFYPGDTGRIDADGVMYIEGRADERLNLDGRKVEPEPIEAVLQSHPAVAEAAVFTASPGGGGARTGALCFSRKAARAASRARTAAASAERACSRRRRAFLISVFDSCQSP